MYQMVQGVTLHSPELCVELGEFTFITHFTHFADFTHFITRELSEVRELRAASIVSLHP